MTADPAPPAPLASPRPAAPAARAATPSTETADAPARPRHRPRRRAAALLELPGGTFWMGSDEDRYPEDGESPPRRSTSTASAIAAHTVTNADFARFVAATGHGTTAEREGWSFVFGGLLPDDFPPTRAVAQAPWWRQVHGATWLHPEGPASDLDGRSDHPVVHVSWIDARALLPLGRRPAAGGGRVGVRRAGRSRAAPLPVGRRADPGRRAPHERVPGPVPRRRHRRRRLRRHRTGGRVPAQRLRAATTRPATCGSGPPTGSAPAGPSGSCAAAPTSATTPTAGATAAPPGRPTPSTAARATSASGWRRTASTADRVARVGPRRPRRPSSHRGDVRSLRTRCRSTDTQTETRRPRWH